MEIKINLETIKPKSNRQKFIFNKLFERIIASNSANNFSELSMAIKHYTDYLKTIKGERAYRYPVKDFLADFIKYKSGKEDSLKNNKDKFLKLMNEAYLVKPHEPKNNDLGQWIGVEIECFIPVADGTNLTHEQFEKLLEKERIKYCDVKHDGSIRPDERALAVEITILTKINDFSNLEKLCKFLSQHKAKVNKSCGLHVHLDQRDVFIRHRRSRESVEMKKELSNRLMRLNQCLPLLSSAVPKSRRENSYCSLARSRMNQRGRYYAINTAALQRYSTLEIRLHSGTTDYVKISNWIKLVYGISRCNKIKNSSRHIVNTFEQLKQKYLTDMSLEMFNYFVQRVETFSRENVVDDVEARQQPQQQITIDSETLRPLGQVLESAAGYMVDWSVISVGDSDNSGNNSAPF